MGDAQRLLDVGSGAGFPGLPLAMVCPDRQWLLVDASAKKIDFILRVCSELKLPNVKAQHIRVEDILAKPPFDVIMTRAVTSSHALSNESALLRSGWSFVDHEGRGPQARIGRGWGAGNGGSAKGSILDAKRHVLIIKGVDCGASDGNHQSERRGG